MRHTHVVLGIVVALAGCSSSDPCQGIDTCVGLTVNGSVAIDQLAIAVGGAVNGTRKVPTSPRAVHLPQSVALEFKPPGGLSGSFSFDIGVVAYKAGAIVAAGTTSATLSRGKHVPATVVLGAATTTGDFGVEDGMANDGSAGDAADLGAGPDMAGTCGVSTAGLLAYYHFEGDGQDSTGNDHTATLSNTTSGTGVLGDGLAFNGTNSKVTLSGTGTVSGARTLCAWVNPSSRTGAGLPVFAGGNLGSGDVYGIEAQSPQSGICTGTANQPYVDHANSCYPGTALSVPLGAWSLVCWAASGGGLTTFVDEMSKVTSAAVYDYATFSTITIGSNAVNAGEGASFLGSIDEVSIWDRVLSQDEVKRMYSAGAGCSLTM